MHMTMSREEARRRLGMMPSAKGPADVVRELEAKVSSVPVPKGIGVKKRSAASSGQVTSEGARTVSPTVPSGVSSVRVTVRVPADLVEAYRRTGRFWQTRMIDVLRAGRPLEVSDG